LCLRQRSLSSDRRLDAENHLVELFSWKVLRRKRRERVHTDCLLPFERKLYVLGRLPESPIGEPPRCLRAGRLLGYEKSLQIGLSETKDELSIVRHPVLPMPNW
jgi:hypothetical protein